MKIKFIKEYVAVAPDTDLGVVHRYRVGETKEIKGYTAEWLIDNGFAEEVKESGWWKPENGENYYFINLAGGIEYTKHEGRYSDEFSVSSGNCFKTYFADDKCRDYWEAIATVRQDEGVLTPREIESTERSNGAVYCITYTFDSGLFVHTCRLAMVLPQVGAIYFNSRGYAQASLGKHPDEWKIIANYDWSRE